MTFNPEKHRRKSIRLKDYDYSSAGMYFLTICVNERKCCLGEITDGEIKLSETGKLVHENWLILEQQFENIELDEFVIMPNHIHGILNITDTLTPVGLMNQTPTENTKILMLEPKQTLGKIVRFFKARSTKLIRDKNIVFQWQRNYFEKIIRSEDNLFKIREYIINNPFNWDVDPENSIKQINDCRGLIHQTQSGLK